MGIRIPTADLPLSKSFYVAAGQAHCLWEARRRKGHHNDTAVRDLALDIRTGRATGRGRTDGHGRGAGHLARPPVASA